MTIPALVPGSSYARIRALESEVERLRAGLETIAFEIDTTEPGGTFADDMANNPPIGLTDEEAWNMMRAVARATLGKAQP